LKGVFAKMRQATAAVAAERVGDKGAVRLCRGTRSPAATPRPFHLAHCALCRAPERTRFPRPPADRISLYPHTTHSQRQTEFANLSECCLHANERKLEGPRRQPRLVRFLEFAVATRSPKRPQNVVQPPECDPPPPAAPAHQDG